MRANLVSAQLAVNIALGQANEPSQPANRAKRQADSDQIDGPASEKDPIELIHYHERTAEIVAARYRARQFSQTELTQIRDLISRLHRRTAENVAKVLNLSEPPQNIEEVVTGAIVNGFISELELRVIMQDAQEAQFIYVRGKVCFSSKKMFH